MVASFSARTPNDAVSSGCISFLRRELRLRKKKTDSRMITITPIPPATPPAIAPVWEWDGGGMEAALEGEETGEETEFEITVDGLEGRADDDVWAETMLFSNSDNGNMERVHTRT